MKLPRDISGHRLIRALQQLGYSVARQKGSHVRLRSPSLPIHHVTVPLHDTLKAGTLHAILLQVSCHLGIDMDELIQRL